MLQCFSTFERLRLAQDSASSNVTAPLTGHNRCRFKAPRRSPLPCLNRNTRCRASSNRRFGKPPSSAPIDFYTQADAQWFMSLPDKVQKKQFTREEQLLLAGRYEPVIPVADPTDDVYCNLTVIPDAADEVFYKFGHQRNPSLPTLRNSSVSSQSSEDFDFLDSDSDMDESMMDSFRWMDEEEDLDLTLDDYHLHMASTTETPKHSTRRPSFRRDISVTNLPFGRPSIDNGLALPKPPYGRPSIDTGLAASNPPCRRPSMDVGLAVSNPPCGRSSMDVGLAVFDPPCGRPSMDAGLAVLNPLLERPTVDTISNPPTPTRRKAFNIPHISTQYAKPHSPAKPVSPATVTFPPKPLTPTHASQTPRHIIETSARHYQDPEARLKLRVYLASPQKFDEALEFGFPSLLQAKEIHIAPGRPALVKHHPTPPLTWFREDQKPSAVDVNSVSDTASPPGTPRTPAFRDPHALSPQKTSTDVDPPPPPPKPPAKPYAHVLSGTREMTLRMTLTRPDLRKDDDDPDSIYGDVHDDAFVLGQLPGLGVSGDIWDSLPMREGVVKKLWQKVSRRGGGV